MDFRKAQTTSLAWTSLAFGLMPFVVLLIVIIASRVPALGTFLSNLGLPNWVTIGFFFVVGVLALLFGLGAVFAITRQNRRGWIPAIVGVVLGLLGILSGLVALAVSNLQLNIGPFA